MVYIEALSKVLPVILLFLLGAFLNKLHFIRSEAIQDMKKLVLNRDAASRLVPRFFPRQPGGAPSAHRRHRFLSLRRGQMPGQVRLGRAIGQHCANRWSDTHCQALERALQCVWAAYPA